MKKEEMTDIKSMGLEGESQNDRTVEDMSLDGTSSAELGTRLAKAFPGTDYIDTGNFQLTKMVAGNFKLDGKTLEEISTEERSEIDRFLRLRGG